MISCKRATELISKQMDEPLGVKEKIELGLHLFICEFCEKFRQQIGSIRESLKTEKPPSPPPEAKARLKKKLGIGDN